MRFAAAPRPLCKNSARMSSRSNSTPAPAARPIRPGAASGWWASNTSGSRRSREFGPNLKGNVEAGLKLTATDYAAAEQSPQDMFHRFHKLFERYDVLLTPAAPVKPYPVEMNFPDTINGRSFENYIDWIAPAYLITLVSLPGGDRAGRLVAGRPADRHADRGAAFRGAADLAGGARNPPAKRRRGAAAGGGL